MYDEDLIKDSLEFCRQMKNFYTDDGSGGSDKKKELTTQDLFDNIASAMHGIGEQRPWEKTLSELEHTGNSGRSKAHVAARQTEEFKEPNTVSPMQGTDNPKPVLPTKEIEKPKPVPLEEKIEEPKPVLPQKTAPLQERLDTPVAESDDSEDDFSFAMPDGGVNTASAAALQQALAELKQLKRAQKNHGQLASIAAEEQMGEQTAASAEQAVDADGEFEQSPVRQQASAADTKRALSKLRASIAAEKETEKSEPEEQQIEGQAAEQTWESGKPKKLSETEIDAILQREIKKSHGVSFDKPKLFQRRESSDRQKLFQRKDSDAKTQNKLRNTKGTKAFERETAKSTLEYLKEQKDNFFYRLANRDRVNEMLATDAEGNKRMVSSKPNSLKLVSNILVIGMCIFIAFSLASLVTNYIAHQTTVEGESMEPTLANEDSVIIQKVSYYITDPKRYDVIVFPVSYDTATKKQTYFIKRVIGLPNETVQIVDGKVYINDKRLVDDSYGSEDILDPGLAAEPITLGSDEYFVLGDNRNISTDSRSSYVGMVTKQNIIGEAWFCIWPLSHFGGIK